MPLQRLDGHPAELVDLRDAAAKAKQESNPVKSIRLFEVIDKNICFYDQQHRAELFVLAKQLTDSWTMSDFSTRIPASPVGTAIAYEVLVAKSPFRTEDFSDLALFGLLAPNLDHELVIDRCLQVGKVTLRAVPSTLSETHARQAMHALIQMHRYGLTDENVSFLSTLVTLVGMIPSMRQVHSLVDTLQTGEEEAFLSACRSLGATVNTHDQLGEVLGLLPFTWELERLVRRGNELVNHNLFPTIVRSGSGTVRYVFPLKAVQSSEVHEIYSYHAKKWLPAETPGPLSRASIFSFERSAQHTPTPTAMSTVKGMIEDDISLRIGKIVNNPNEFKHGPTEVADVITPLQLFKDSRPIIAAMVLKARSTDPVNPKAVSHQLIRAFQAYPDVVFLVYTTRLLNEVQQELITLSQKFHIPFCVLGPHDLAALFEAYSVL